MTALLELKVTRIGKQYVAEGEDAQRIYCASEGIRFSSEDYKSIAEVRIPFRNARTVFGKCVAAGYTIRTQSVHNKPKNTAL